MILTKNAPKLGKTPDRRDADALERQRKHNRGVLGPTKLRPVSPKIRRLISPEAKARARGRMIERIQWYNDLKAIMSCIRCGISDPDVLTFHHRDPKEKDSDISKLARSSRTKAMKELEKCDCLCLNCHARVHKSNRQEKNGRHYGGE